LQPYRFLGGDFRLNANRAGRVLSTWLKRQRSKLTVQEFSAGVIRVVNATMEKAIRVVSIERGYDPREFALVAFGGAGGLHACELAEALGIPRVIVPALPGALSAFGILVSDVVKDYSRTLLWRVHKELPARQLDREFTQLRGAAAKHLRQEGWRGAIRYHRSIDVRYRGQGYELNLPYTHALLGVFRREHQRQYGHSYPKREVELVTVRLRATIRSQPVSLPPRNAANGALPVPQSNTPSAPEQAAVVFGGQTIRTAIYSRDELRAGKKYSGPAVVTEYSATTVVPPGMRFWVDRAANLVVGTGST
jgi:N-methylhydantoinase A